MANRRYIDFPIASTSGDTDIILIWQGGANKQTTKATFLSGLPENLDELNDVAISGLTNGQILRYDSVTGKWENTDQGNLDLNDLNDVSIVSPSNGQVLVYNSSTGKWENSSGGYVPYTGAVTTVNLGAQTIQAGQFVKAGGTAAQFLKADGSVDSNVYGTGTVTSVALTMPSAFSVANSPITTSGTLAVTGAGNVGQYIRGDGSLADFPESSGGGSSVSYYLNGSVAQGTIGGIAYKELNKVPILGAGTDFTINANGYIASFITDAGDPNLLEIPGGNWNFETYFSASSGGGSPSFYVELYKVNSGGTATLIASNSGFPELIAFGTNIISYFSTLAVPTTTLALTDRLAIRYYVNHSGRTITLHTEDNHLCQIITTFTTGITALNGLTAQVQNFAVGTSGTDFAIASATATHTFNLPTASATNRGALSSADWSTFNNKENAITAGTTAQYFRGDKTFQTLNTAAVPELTNLYYTEARVNANANVAANTAARHNAVTLGTANGLSLSTQVLSLGLASAGVTGALSGTDWTTFNNKQNALTNPVTGTGTTNYLPKFTSSTTIGNSQVFDNGTNVGIGTASLSNKLDVLGSAASPTLVGTNAYARFYQSGGYANVTIGALASGSFAGWIQTSDGVGTALPLSLQPSGGNLLVGTTTDNGARLQVSGTATISGNVTTNKIGVGGAAATYSLTAYNASNGTTAAFGGTARGIRIDNDGTFSSGRSTIFGVDSSFYASYQPLSIEASSLALQAVTGGNVLIGTTTDNGARLQVSGAGNTAMSVGGNGYSVFTGSAFSYTPNNIGLSLGYNRSGGNGESSIVWGAPAAGFNFEIASVTSNVITPRMTITSSGNVGIGTVSPPRRLSVHNESGGAAISLATNLTGTTQNIFLVGNTGSGVNDGYMQLFDNGVAKVTIAANASRGGDTYFNGGGNFLIGTATSGASRLRIVGLPTSSSGLSSGDVWNNGGTLRIV